MKLIHGFILALILSLSLPTARAAEDAAAPSAAPDNAPGIAPAKDANSKATAKNSETRTEVNPPEDATVKRNNSNVRGRPSFVGEVITRLKKGEPVKVLEEIKLNKTRKNEPADWLRIAMPANTPVWVSAHFIDPATKTVTATQLHVRAGPGENYSVVGMLPKGAEIKEIREVNNWIEIETPSDAYAFVAADLIDRAAPTTTAPATTEPTPTAPPAPEPAPEVVSVPPDVSDAPLPAEPVAPPAPEVTQPAEVAPPIEVTPPPAEEEKPPKRIVTREGIVRHSFNVQTPSYFELESTDTKKVINYLYSPQPDFSLKEYIGQLVTVTGEEYIDKRWPNTPVIKIESLEQQ